MAERSGVSKEIGEALLKQTKRLFHWWHRVRDGTLSTELFQAAMARLRQSVHHLLSEAASLCHSSTEQTPLAKTARTCLANFKARTGLVDVFRGRIRRADE